MRFTAQNGTTEFLRFSSTGDATFGGSVITGGLVDVRTSHTSTDVTAANSNTTLRLLNSGSGDGVYNAIKFSGNQQDMYIMSFNNNTQADRRLGFFVGSVAGDATTDEKLSIMGDGSVTANPSGGVITLGANGHITSKQSLDVITAGGRYMGSSNRGLLGQMRIEQTAQGADGGYIALDTSSVGSTSPTERMRIGSDANVLIGTTQAGGVRLNVETNQNGNLAGQFRNTHATGSYGIKVMGGHDISNYSAVFTDKDNNTLMMIRGNGNTGIGTDSIATNTKLHVKAGTNINFEVENSSSTLRLSALNDARSANVPIQFAASFAAFNSSQAG